MKWLIVVLLFVPTMALACKEGYVPTDVPGVCQEGRFTRTDPAVVSDEKPSHHPQPAYQRVGEVTIVDAPNCAKEDERMDQEKISAGAEGRKKAGITIERKTK